MLRKTCAALLGALLLTAGGVARAADTAVTTITDVVLKQNGDATTFQIPPDTVLLAVVHQPATGRTCGKVTLDGGTQLDTLPVGMSWAAGAMCIWAVDAKVGHGSGLTGSFSASQFWAKSVTIVYFQNGQLKSVQLDNLPVKAASAFAATGATTVSDGSVWTPAVTDWTFTQKGDLTTFETPVNVIVLAELYMPAEGRTCGKHGYPSGRTFDTIPLADGAMCVVTAAVGLAAPKGKGLWDEFFASQFWAKSFAVAYLLENGQIKVKQLDGLPVKAPVAVPVLKPIKTVLCPNGTPYIPEKDCYGS